ncbi:MAG: hypothetical protein L6416_12065 [Candidatus Omnitrophica bacterium]|nr:hypothetical protein [Candidatus Omnitrophota bacterium]
MPRKRTRNKLFLPKALIIRKIKNKQSNPWIFIYDEFKNEYVFLVSGSGRLDTYQKGGDSLTGRYFKWQEQCIGYNCSSMVIFIRLIMLIGKRAKELSFLN